MAMRSANRSFLAGLAIAAAASCVAAVALAQTYPLSLVYRARDGRSEGLVSEPRSANALYLVSATADRSPRENLVDWPPALRLRFYYPRGVSRPPSIRIWQLRSLSGYYRLDGPASSSWMPGAFNDFSWTKAIIAGIYDYQVPAGRRQDVSRSDWLSELGVIVDLGSTGQEKLVVAPAAFDHGGASTVAAYLFTFRTLAAASVTGTIRDAAGRAVLSNLAYRVNDAGPFTVRWPVVPGTAEGWYTLQLNASLPGEPQVELRFYHPRTETRAE